MNLIEDDGVVVQHLRTLRNGLRSPPSISHVPAELPRAEAADVKNMAIESSQLHLHAQQLAEATERVAAVQASLASAEAERQSLTTAMALVAAQKLALERRIATMEAEQTAHEATLRDYAAAQRRGDEDRQLLTRTNHALRAEVKLFEEQWNPLVVRVAHVEQLTERLAATHQQLRHQVRELDEARRRAEEFGHEAASARATAERLKATYAAHRSEWEASTAQLRDATAMVLEGAELWVESQAECAALRESLRLSEALNASWEQRHASYRIQQQQQPHTTSSSATPPPSSSTSTFVEVSEGEVAANREMFLEALESKAVDLAVALQSAMERQKAVEQAQEVLVQQHVGDAAQCVELQALVATLRPTAEHLTRENEALRAALLAAQHFGDALLERHLSLMEQHTDEVMHAYLVTEKMNDVATQQQQQQQPSSTTSVAGTYHRPRRVSSPSSMQQLTQHSAAVSGRRC